jgi:hypothetical protein
MSNEEFNYDEMWDKQEEKIREELVEKLPKGYPRKGIKGKYIKRKGYVSKRQIKNSYNN